MSEPSPISSRFPWFPVALILVGTTMLLDRFDVLPVQWQIVAWGVLMLFGAHRVILGFTARWRGRAFWGTFLFLIGLYNILYHLDVVERYPHMFVPVIMVTVGFSLLMMYAVAPKEWHILIPALVLAGLGGILLFAEYGYFDRWEIMWVIRRYWPVALILFGVSLLLKKRAPDSQSSSD